MAALRSLDRELVNAEALVDQAYAGGVRTRWQKDAIRDAEDNLRRIRARRESEALADDLRAADGRAAAQGAAA